MQLTDSVWLQGVSLYFIVNQAQMKTKHYYFSDTYFSITFSDLLQGGSNNFNVNIC